MNEPISTMKMDRRDFASGARAGAAAFSQPLAARRDHPIETGRCFPLLHFGSHFVHKGSPTREKASRWTRRRVSFLALAADLDTQGAETLPLPPRSVGECTTGPSATRPKRERWNAACLRAIEKTSLSVLTKLSSVRR